MYRYAVIISTVLLVSACSSWKAVVAMTRSTEHFIELESEPRIRYEKGSSALALKLAPHLDQAIQAVEAKQYRAFADKVMVFVPASIGSFASYCGSRFPAACVVGSRLFISPRLLNAQARIAKILTHELSHLQLSQSLGRWAYQRNLPSWFVEGLAVYVSGGGGAEKVSESEAIRAIIAGRAIVPTGSGSLLFQKTASSFGLKPHMFYRQSALYVAWLHRLDAVKFKQLILLLHKRHPLDAALKASYGFDVATGWARFTAGLRAPAARGSTRGREGSPGRLPKRHRPAAMRGDDGADQRLIILPMHSASFSGVQESISMPVLRSFFAVERQ